MAGSCGLFSETEVRVRCTCCTQEIQGGLEKKVVRFWNSEYNLPRIEFYLLEPIFSAQKVYRNKDIFEGQPQIFLSPLKSNNCRTIVKS